MYSWLWAVFAWIVGPPYALWQWLKRKAARR